MDTTLTIYIAIAWLTCKLLIWLDIVSSAGPCLASSLIYNNASLYDTLPGLLDHSSAINDMQALGQRCMSAEAIERPKFDEVLLLVDALDVDT